MRLTDLAIDRLKPPESGQQTYFDDALKGFGVRVSQGGSKSFVVMYGKERRLKTLGRYPSVSLKNARTLAKGFQASEKPTLTTLTVSDAIPSFLEHSERHNRPRTTADYKRLLNRHLPTGKLQDISRSSLLEKLNRLADTPAEQSHATTAIKVFLNWCASTGRMEQNPIASVRGIGRIKKRSRTLSQVELAKLYKRGMEYGYPFGTMVCLLILGGQRKGEMQKLRRSYIQDSKIVLPSAITKNGHEHVYPIGALTKALVSTVQGDDILFPGRADDSYWNGFGKTKALLDKGLDIDHYTLHDIRRSFASLHAEIGTPLHVVEKLLNHLSGTFSGVQGVYQRYSFWDEQVLACTAYEARIKEIVSA